MTSGQQERKSKQRKIRNSEYYDMEGTFDRLYAESKKDKTFNHLMEIIESEENIKLAYRTIKKNTGSDTSVQTSGNSNYRRSDRTAMYFAGHGADM